MKKRVKKQKRYKWGAFVCHVTEDKKSFVMPLAQELEKFGIRVWLDKFVLKVGDSLRRKIDEGLSKSRYGIVVFSPAFFQKEWPQSELDGLFAREMEGKKKVILPIAHGISISELIDRVPLLAGKLILNSSEGVAEIARQLVKEIRPQALKLDQSRADAQKANNRLLDQLQKFGKNPTIDYRVITGHGAAPDKFDLESMERLEVKDALASIFHPGMRIDLFPKNKDEYAKHPLHFKLSLLNAGAKKFMKALETGRAQKLTAGEFGDFQMSLELFPSFKGLATDPTLIFKPLAGGATPVRVTLGEGSTSVVYDLMTHRMVRSGTQEAHSILEGNNVPFVMHFRMRRKPKFDAKVTIEPNLKGQSVGSVKKFVQAKRALWNSGAMEIFGLEFGKPMRAGKLSLAPATESESWFGRLVDDVAAIADFFEIEIKWPTKITEEDMELLIALKWMIEKKSYGTGARFTSIVTKTNENVNLFETLGSGGSMWITRGEPLVFLGTPIEGFTIAFHFEQANVTEFEPTKDRFDRAAIGDEIEVKFEVPSDTWVKLWDVKQNKPVERPPTKK
jgi:TIR domain